MLFTTKNERDMRSKDIASSNCRQLLVDKSAGTAVTTNSTSAPLPRPPIPNNVEHDLAGRPDSPPLIYKSFVPTVITLKLFYLWP